MALNPNAPAFVPLNRSNRKSRKQRGGGGMGLMSCPKGKVYSWALKKCVSKKSTKRKNRK